MPGGYYTPTTATPISTASHNEFVRDQTVNQFASAAARTSAVSSPVAGMLSWRTDGKLWEGYDGSSWLAVARFTDYKRKTSDESVSSANTGTTLQNDDALAWAVAASGVYALDLFLIYNANSTGNLKLGWTFPTSLTMVYAGMHATLAGALTVASFTQASTPAIGGLGADAPQHFHGMVTNSTNAGTLQLQFAQNTSNAGNTTLKAGSYGVLTRLA